MMTATTRLRQRPPRAQPTLYPPLQPPKRKVGRPRKVALVDDQREDDALQVAPAPTLLVSIRSAAQMLEIGQPKVRELLTQGAFSSIKIGSTLRRIPVAQLQAYVARLVAEQCEAGV